jgi:hypothetical protein
VVVVLHLMDCGGVVVPGTAYGMRPYFRIPIDIKHLGETCRRMQLAAGELVYGEVI